MGAPDPHDEFLESKRHQYRRFVKLAAVIGAVVLIGLLVLARVLG